jgi:membrane protein YqaA with SNARE-associated domain
MLEAVSIWLRQVLLPYGGLGLMVLAIGDSSFLSLPEVNDILLMTFAIAHPERMLQFAALTTMGSVAGCALLYFLGRRGGETFINRRFSGERLVRIRNWYGRYGVFAVIIPSLLPPPTPFKVFVLSAGAFGISWTRFLMAVVIGRGIRYFSEGILAVLYGAAAIEFVRDNYGKIGLALGIVIATTVIVWVYTRRRMRSIEV